MDFFLRINEQLGEAISSRVRGIGGLLLHSLVLALIIGLVGYFVYWLIRILLASLVWLAPAIVIVLVVLIIAYLLSKVNRLYK